MSEATRAWIYRVSLAVTPLLVFYGLASDAEGALWLGVVGGILGTGVSALASANTSTKKPEGE